MIPTKKSPIIREMLDGMSNRSDSIRGNVCVPPPYGCGLPITPFRDKLSEREYRVSGLCQQCQDSIFNK